MKKRTDGRYTATKVVNGKRLYGYGKTREEAAENLKHKIKEDNIKVWLPTTFKQLADRWYNDKWDSFSYGTQNGYRSAMQRANEEWGYLKAADITPVMIKELLEKMKREGYGLKSVKNQKAVISTIFRHGIESGLCSSNPATSVELPKGLTSTKREPPSEEAVEKIKQTDFLPALIMMYTGARRGEALALSPADIDFKKRTITINKEIIFESNTPRLVHRTKTDAGMRTVPLLDPLAEKLKDWQGFDTLTLRRFKTSWAHFETAIGEHITPHQLRHYYASFLYDAGLFEKDIKMCQKLLGHSTLAMTQDVYTHIRTSRLDGVTDLLNQHICGQ